MDYIIIDELTIDTIIGIHPHEQTAAQPLRMSLRMGFDNRLPAATESVADTLDYDVIASRLRQHAQARSWLLIETLAETSAQILRGEFGVSWLRLRIDKPQAVPLAKSVGVIIERDFRLGAGNG
ncbi:MAG: dihydroneopterin aldolase [Pseudomarimonas sp.]